jgi:hypothetical protein
LPAKIAGLRARGPLNLGTPDDYRVPDKADLRERAVEWFRRADDGFERAGASQLLSVDEAALTAEIDWPR